MSVVSTVVAFGALVALIAVCALLGAAEASITLMERGRARRLAEADRKGAHDLVRVMERPGRILATRALVAAVSYAASGALFTWALTTTYQDVPVYVSVLVALGIGAVAIFVFGEALPRAVAVQSPERVALASARLAGAVARIVYPLARLLSIVWTWGMTLVTGRSTPGAPWTTLEEHEGVFSGEGEEEERDEAAEALMDAVEHFSGRIVREVMVPRTDVRSLEDTATASEALELIREAGFSRLPVFHDSLDDIRGVLYARDLLLALGDGFDPDMRVVRLVRAAYFVPETKPVWELLLEMRSRPHIAMVADEYGGTAGLVTIEDLLEEIVGDIFDEYDRQVPMIVDLGEGRYRVDARLSVSELNETFDTAIDREADSVGGLFIEEAGHIPDAVESVEVEGLRLIVQELEGNRIRQLIVETAGVAGEEGQNVRDHAV